MNHFFLPGMLQRRKVVTRIAMLTTAMLVMSLLTQAQIEATGPLFRRLGAFNPSQVDDNRLNGSLVSSVPSDQGGEIIFSNPLTMVQATGNDPNTDFPWGNGYYGKAYGNLQSTVTTLTLPGNTKAFYFSVKPLLFEGNVTVTATSYNGHTVSSNSSNVTNTKAVQFGFRVTNVMDNVKTITITLNNSITPYIGEFLINQCDPYTFTVNASNGGVLTCSHPTLQLTAPAPDFSYDTPGSALSVYTYRGPNGFYERKPQDPYNYQRYANVSAPGTYTVTIEQAGSCTATGIVIVTEDKKLPTNVTLNTDGGTLTCKETSVTLMASSTNGTNYAFSGPRGFSHSGTDTSISVTEPGTYFLIVTASNGCSAGVQNVLVNAEATPPAEVTQSLIDLYNATGGPNWTHKDNWIVSCNPCGWYGVTCTNGRVTALNLIGNNLRGTLPASLSVLTSLQSLELGANALTGGIPLGIGNLTALQTLNLSRTQLGGTIPANLGGLTRLQNLLLNESALTGSLPANLGGLTRLQNLQLYTNQLSGCIPTSYTALCGRSQISFANNPNLSGGGDFGAFCRDGTGSELVVSQGPQSGNACVGSAFNFSVVARGAGSYQWYKDGQRLAESGPVLSFSSVSASDAGTYQVYINYGCRPGAVQSDFVTLTVNQPGTGGCPQANTPPVATANASQTARAGSAFSYTVTAFTDAETPTSLTYSASLDPANSGLTFDPATRVISGTPGQPGPVSVTVTATDPGRLSASTSFTINVGPRLVNSTPLRVTLTASPQTLLTSGSTVLRATALGGNVGAPPNGYTYHFSGPGTFISSGDGSVTVSDLPAGVQTFTVVVSDAMQPVSQTTSATVSVTVSATNTPPVATANANQTATVGVAFSYTVQAFTDDQTPTSLTYSASLSPANGLTFNPATRILSGTPTASGSTQVTITALDPGGLSASTSFSVVVQPAPVVVTSLLMGAPLYDCATRQVTVRTTGGNGQPITYQIPSVTTGWETTSTFILQNKHLGKDLKLRARQRSSTGGGYVEVESSFTPTACGSGRQAVIQEPGASLQVVVLGNPVTGQELWVDVRGAEGQPLRLTLTDLSGRSVTEQYIEQAGTIERRSLEMSSGPAGLLLLRVSTPTQSRVVKVLKAE